MHTGQHSAALAAKLVSDAPLDPLGVCGQFMKDSGEPREANSKDNLAAGLSIMKDIGKLTDSLTVEVGQLIPMAAESFGALQECLTKLASVTKGSKGTFTKFSSDIVFEVISSTTLTSAIQSILKGFAATTTICTTTPGDPHRLLRDLQLARTPAAGATSSTADLAARQCWSESTD